VNYRFITSLKQDAQLHLQAGQMMTNAPFKHKRAEEIHFFKCCDHTCEVNCVFMSKAEEHKILFKKITLILLQYSLEGNLKRLHFALTFLTDG